MTPIRSTGDIRSACVRRVAALALATLLWLPTGAIADADGPDHWRVAGVGETSALNVRAAPALDAPLLGTLAPTARCLVNLGCVGEPDFATWLDMTEAEREAARADRWCRVRHDSLEGWVAGRYLVEDDGTGGTCPQR